MARIVITGGSGFLGHRVAKALLQAPNLTIKGAKEPLESLCLMDRVPSPLAESPAVECLTGSLEALLVAHSDRFLEADCVFHLASAVSGECEADLALGLDANLGPGIRLGRLLAEGSKQPVLVFASSLAVYGAPPGEEWPVVVTDALRPRPQNSYGSQKLMLETLYADLHRRGLISARTLRLMTVSVRPGAPNGAASGFLSAMIREPLFGRSTEVPVAPDLKVALNSPAGAVSGLIRAASFPDSQWGDGLGVNLPGLSVSVAEIVESLIEVGGPEMAGLLQWTVRPEVASLVGRWPHAFDSARARQLGFAPEPSFSDVIRQFLAEIAH